MSIFSRPRRTRRRDGSARPAPYWPVAEPPRSGADAFSPTLPWEWIRPAAEENLTPASVFGYRAEGVPADGAPLPLPLPEGEADSAPGTASRFDPPAIGSAGPAGPAAAVALAEAPPAVLPAPSVDPAESAVTAFPTADTPAPEPDEAEHAEVERTVLVPRRRTGWTLDLPDGRQLLVGRVGLVIGRDPGALEDFPLAELVPIVDVTRSLSKSHALFIVAGGGLWVTDLGSTNGTVVVSLSGETEVLPDHRVPVQPGDRVELGRLDLRISQS